MPALFAYLIAVALLLGGGYGALSWLASPEPVKVMAKAKPKPPPAHYADNSQPAAAEASRSEASSPDASKPEAVSKTEIDTSDQVKAASNDKAASSDQPPSASSSPQPEPPAAASQLEAKAQASGPARDRQDRQQDRSARAGMPQPATDQEAKQQVEAPPAAAKQNDSALARREEEKHEEEKRSAQAVSPGNAQTIASIAPTAAAKRPYARQASRRSEHRPLEVMTLRTIELPDGRRITQLIPHRSGDRYRDDGRAMVFEPDE